MDNEKKIQMTVLETEILCQSGMKFLNVFDTYSKRKENKYSPAYTGSDQ